MFTGLCVWAIGCRGVPDRGLIEVPVHSIAPGEGDPAREWQDLKYLIRRTSHVLGQKLGTGPDSLRVEGGEIQVKGTVLSGGVPCRNDRIDLVVKQHDQPVILLLRSTDAFGEVQVVLDMLAGTVSARSVTVNRIMTGESGPSPSPGESANALIAESRFAPLSKDWHRVTVRELEERIGISVDGSSVFEFNDPDPAGGHYGIGSAGLVSIKSVRQYELVTPSEQERRDRCLRDMAQLARSLDADFDADVKKVNVIDRTPNALTWTFRPTGCRAVFSSQQGDVTGTLRAGLYGDDEWLSGPMPRIEASTADGRVFRTDRGRKPDIVPHQTGLTLRLPLCDDTGARAQATVEIRFTVHPVWFWRVTIAGVEPKSVRAFFTLAAGAGAVTGEHGEASSDAATGKPATRCLQHNGRSGVYFQTCDAGTAVALQSKSEPPARSIAVTAASPQLRFATLWLPAQRLNRIGFTNRMVHFIRYHEGPVQHWRTGPAESEYPSDEEIEDYAAHGTEAMVWHHTWASNNYRQRDGFVVNDKEMKRAIEHCRRRGIAVITYIGIVPGRNPLLRYDDLAALYDKNWDLQDFSFYATAGRWQEFLPWITDSWCRRYGLDGFYVDGALGLDGWGLRGTLRTGADAEGLTQDEITYRMYYRVRKVFERHGARFGLENWGGSPVTLLTPFYDCRMIGEAFQRARPEDYRDGYNALLTGATFKMYGMRDTSRDDYNVAMAAINLSDIQICSGNKAWGCHPITPADWVHLVPFWKVLESIDFDNLVEAMPWWAQTLVAGDGFYAANYTQRNRVLVFLANKTNDAGEFAVRVNIDKLPTSSRTWHIRQVYPTTSDLGSLGDGRVSLKLPPLEAGPIAIELTPAK